MADGKRFRVRIDRAGYWRLGRPIPVGSEIVLPEHALEGVTRPRPPFGVVLGAVDEAVTLFESPAGAPPGATADVMRETRPDEWTDFTE